MGFTIVAILAVILIPILIPLNYYAYVPTSNDDDNSDSNQNSTNPVESFGHVGLSQFSIANIPQSSSLLYIHTLAVYFVSFICYFYLYYAYRDYVRLANEYMNENGIARRNAKKAERKQFRTIMVRQVPEELRNDQAFKEYFERLSVGPVQNAVMDRQGGGKLINLIKDRDKCLDGLERAYVRWLKNIKREKRREETRWGRLRRRLKKCLPVIRFNLREQPTSTPSVNVAAALVQGLEPSEIIALRPKHRVDTHFGLGGRLVDSIDHYSTHLRELTAQIEQIRLLAKYPQTAKYGTIGFITFQTQHAATLAAQVVLRRANGPWAMNVQMAPAPNDIVWSSLSMSPQRKWLQEHAIAVLCFFLCFFWIIPTSFVVCPHYDLSCYFSFLFNYLFIFHFE